MENLRAVRVAKSDVSELEPANNAGQRFCRRTIAYKAWHIEQLSHAMRAGGCPLEAPRCSGEAAGRSVQTTDRTHESHQRSDRHVALVDFVGAKAEHDEATDRRYRFNEQTQ